MRLITTIVYLLLTSIIMATGVCASEAPFIGISKIVSHPALDALEQGVQDGIKMSFPNAKFDLQNANGEMTTASSIAKKFKAQGVDLAVGIATPTAQALVNTFKNSPVIYCAVTDPVGAGLIESTQKGEKNITGTSDMTPVRAQIELLNKIKPLKRLGHIYSSGEANAVSLAAIAKKVCADMGIEFVEATVTNSSEVKQAVQAIAGRIDGIYLSNDNTIFSALNAITTVARKHKIPIMSADPSSALDNEVLAAWGFDYYKMGVVTGKLAARVLRGEKCEDIPTRFMTDPTDIDLLVNLDSASYLGLVIPEDIIKAADTVIKDGKIDKK
jgi:putative ABC transport system substrate-binding protein